MDNTENIGESVRVRYNTENGNLIIEIEPISAKDLNEVDKLDIDKTLRKDLQERLVKIPDEEKRYENQEKMAEEACRDFIKEYSKPDISPDGIITTEKEKIILGHQADGDQFMFPHCLK